MKVLAGGNHFAIYTCIKSTQCIPETYTVFYVHCISVKPEGKEKEIISKMEVRTEEIIWNRQAELEMFSKKRD